MQYRGEKRKTAYVCAQISFRAYIMQYSLQLQCIFRMYLCSVCTFTTLLQTNEWQSQAHKERAKLKAMLQKMNEIVNENHDMQWNFC